MNETHRPEAERPPDTQNDETRNDGAPRWPRVPATRHAEHANAPRRKIIPWPVPPGPAAA
jgi:hypothetical protein